MSKPEFLTFEEYKQKVQEMAGGHWAPDRIEGRWDYHARTINLVKELNLKDASKILEMGTMGMQCIKNSKTIDYAERWDFPGKNPDYLHDARHIPWPIRDKEYDLFIALRVFQHLSPNQEECVNEAMRIANKIIIVTSEYYNTPLFPDSKGITYNDFFDYFKGIHPNLYIPDTAHGSLFYWDLEKPSYFNLEKVMKSQYVKFNVHSPKQKNHLLNSIKNKIKKIIK